MTDAKNNPTRSKNIDIDSAAVDSTERDALLRRTIVDMDRNNKPIRVALNDTLVLSYLHYGESALIRQLRWLPVSEIAIATIFISHRVCRLQHDQAGRAEQHLGGDGEGNRASARHTVVEPYGVDGAVAG